MCTLKTLRHRIKGGSIIATIWDQLKEIQTGLQGDQVTLVQVCVDIENSMVHMYVDEDAEYGLEGLSGHWPLYKDSNLLDIAWHMARQSQGN